MKSQVLFELFMSQQNTLCHYLEQGRGYVSGGSTRSCPKYGKSSSALSGDSNVGTVMRFRVVGGRKHKRPK